MFKNETHNHPTEIEPFGGAATCLGGAIRDPLSGRTYVYQAMRVTGAADPRDPLDETLHGKLPQRKIDHRPRPGLQLLRQPDRPGHRPGDGDLPPGLRGQAHGDRRGHGRGPGENVVPGDARSRAISSFCWADAPAATAAAAPPAPPRPTPRNPSRPAAPRCRRATPPPSARSSGCSATREVTRLIKRCNDFGAGGVSRGHRRAGRRPGHRSGQGAQEIRRPGRHGAGHLRVPGAHGRGGGSRGRGGDSCAAAAEENLEATAVAEVTAEPRLAHELEGQHHRGHQPRVPEHQRRAQAGQRASWRFRTVRRTLFERQGKWETSVQNGLSTLSDLNVCSQKGLVERFDSTIGAGTVYHALRRHATS